MAQNVLPSARGATSPQPSAPANPALQLFAGQSRSRNSLSNLEHVASRHNDRTLTDMRTGDAFSGIYNLQSRRFLAYRSGSSHALNRVPRYGGHFDVEQRFISALGDNGSSVAFTIFAEDIGFSIGWRSRGVNGYYFDDIEAPRKYREEIMQAIFEATGRKVWQR